MKKVDQLTIVACSGSILAATLFSNSGGPISLGESSSAQRSMANSPDVSAAVEKIDFAEAKRLAQQSPAATDRDDASSYEARKEQAALSRFGCGCETCCASTSVGGGEEGQVIQLKQFISTATIHRAPRL
jgi:hypothetical protein